MSNETEIAAKLFTHAENLTELLAAGPADVAAWATVISKATSITHGATLALGATAPAPIVVAKSNGNTLSKCRDCESPVHWLEITSGPRAGKKMMTEVEGVAPGTTEFSKGAGHVPHFTVCPMAGGQAM